MNSTLYNRCHNYIYQYAINHRIDYNRFCLYSAYRQMCYDAINDETAQYYAKLIKKVDVVSKLDFYYDDIKLYPDGYTSCCCRSFPVFRGYKFSLLDKRNITEIIYQQLFDSCGYVDITDLSRLVSEKLEYRKKRSFDVARKRALRKVYDYSHSCFWDFFVTLTFSPEKVDRQSYSDINNKVSNWLSNIRKKYGSDFKYLLVPEFHSDCKSYHLHGFFSNVPDTAIAVSPNNNYLYNLKDWHFGYSDIQRVVSQIKATNYITKYVSKNGYSTLIDDNCCFYWVSRNLKLPEQHFFKNSFVDVDNYILYNNFEVKNKFSKVNFNEMLKTETFYFNFNRGVENEKR